MIRTLIRVQIESLLLDGKIANYLKKKGTI